MNAQHLANLVAAAKAHYDGMDFEAKSNAGDLFHAINVGKADLAEIEVEIAVSPAWDSVGHTHPDRLLRSCVVPHPRHDGNA